MINQVSSSYYAPSAESVTSRFFVYSSKWKEVRQLTVVNLRNNESQDQLLKRFRKKIVKSGVLSTVRRKRWFVSKSEQRRMDQKKAIRRYKRRAYKDFE
jgi:small subunit ribosomal protein S21